MLPAADTLAVDCTALWHTAHSTILLQLVLWGLRPVKGCKLAVQARARAADHRVGSWRLSWRRRRPSRRSTPAAPSTPHPRSGLLTLV
jgi:hypothetical protein